ncbi:MAG: OmpH family outer membrane protein [Limnobacter sp.]|nr:OmpH family outer membrane protein [Limnobacter sp.]
MGLKGFKLAILSAVISASAYAPLAAAQAQTLKIGFVNTERILRDSTFAVQAQKRLEGDFSKRQKELESLAAKVRADAVKLDKDSITLPESEKVRRQRELAEADREFQRKRREFDEDLAQKKSQLVGELVERANKVIRELAERENYDIILQEAVYANKRIDVTDKVLQRLDGGK